MLTRSSAAQAAATLPLFSAQAAPDKVSGLFHAATALAQLLAQGRALDSRSLRSAMEAAFGASDADGVWVWKDAYEASEAAQVLYLRKFGGPMRARAGSRESMLDMLVRLAERLPSQTRRSEESERFQQFSTPIALGFVAAEAAALSSGDLTGEGGMPGWLALNMGSYRAFASPTSFLDSRCVGGVLRGEGGSGRAHPKPRRRLSAW